MSRIKSCFRSRFPSGVLLEVDFSQLEVVGVALLSNDPVLKDDIRSGRDMHRVRAAQLFGITEAAVTKDQRQIAKVLSFQLQYGAGAKSMAAKNNIAEELASKFIKQYYDRYEVLQAWQNDNIRAVAASRVATKERTKLGEPRGKGTLATDTGRMYTFMEEDAPEWMRNRKYGVSASVSFSPTQIKNYPSQGFATGDVMALFRAMLMEKYRNNPVDFTVAVPVMTIHDSVLFDCFNKGWAEVAEHRCKELAASLPEKIESLWGIRCDLPFKVEGKCGETWADMKPLS